MAQHAGQHNGDDLHITVRVGTKASSRRDGIVVADPHRAEGCIVRIIEIAKREDMTALQPAVIEPVCRLCRIYCNQYDLLLKAVMVCLNEFQGLAYLQCSRKLRKQEETGTGPWGGIRFFRRQQVQ
jgi:hypothetical protein